MEKENPAQHKQTISVVNGKPFITTQLVRTDVNGKEFITFESTQPYGGSIEQLKEETEALKAKEIERHEAVIADADAKLAQIQEQTDQVIGKTDEVIAVVEPKISKQSAKQ